jgi:hypothetical protein
MRIIFLALLSACSNYSPDAPQEVRWRPITPPRSGLRCWEAGHAAYCEPDPSATHGASQ